MENNETIPTPNATPAANPASTPPSAAPSGTATPPPPAGGVKPALYNPNVASSLSVFFTPIFGGWCCRHNYRALGLPDKAKRSQIWMIVSLVYLLLSLFVPGVGKGWLIFLVVWYYCDGRKQAQYLKENNIAYEKKGWLKPVLVAAGALLLWILAFVLFAGDKAASRGANGATTGASSKTLFVPVEAVTSKVTIGKKTFGICYDGAAEKDSPLVFFVPADRAGGFALGRYEKASEGKQGYGVRIGDGGNIPIPMRTVILVDVNAQICTNLNRNWDKKLLESKQDIEELLRGTGALD